MKQTNRKQSGMTLIELMVTIAIVGILAAIAIPSYTYYTRSTKRSVAKTALQQVRGLLEQTYLNTKVYPTNMTTLGFQNSPLEVNKAGNEGTAASAVYQVVIHTQASGGMTFCANCDYEIVATAMNAQANDTTCTKFWFDSLGRKGAVDNNNADKTSACW